MSKHFGKTWWGEQWLQSLSNIDYDNRLPRGSAYARNGAVTSIKIDGNNIKAKVAGSRPRPYDVIVIIPPFFEEDVKKLIKAIALKPVIISKLLNRELDPEILSIAEQCGLKVFPKQWTDFKMQCSCPDWAVPCKHLAAVVYKVSAEIDNNPFLAFSLHRVDLPSELKKENIHIQQQGKNDIPLLKNLLLPEKPKKYKKKEETAALTGNENNSQKLNFASLSPIHDPLIQLLADEPVFYQNAGNFREKYAISLRKAVRNAERIIQGKRTIDDCFPAGKNTKHETLLINHHTTVSLHINSSNIAEVIIEGSGKKNPLMPFISELWHIPGSHIQDYQPSVAALKNCFLLAVNLIASGAVVPQIVQLEKGRFAIRWLPAMLSKQVRVLVQQMQQTLPGHILHHYNDKTNDVIEKDAAIHLISVWLGVLMQSLSETGQSDLFLGLFFDNFKYNFNAPGEQALSGGIHQWLQRYYFTQGGFKPEIVVEELRSEQFLITVNIKEINNPLEKPVSLRDVLTLKKYEPKKFEILQSLAQLSSFIPGLDNYINTQGDDLIMMNMQAFAPFLMQAIPAIQLLDINILLPKSLQHILKPKATVHIKQKAAKGNGFMRLDKLLDFDWQVAIGDTVMSEDEFKKLLKNSDGLIKYKTRYIYVSPADLEKLHKHFSSSKTLSAFEIFRTALSNDYFGAKINLTDEVKNLIKELTSHKEIPLPKEIKATLRPYQHRGFSWMYRNTQIGFGSVIADDMGLGKTLQVITALLKFKEENTLKKEKALVIAPTGLLSNWQAEFEKFAPSLIYKIHHGTSRKLKDDDFDVMITSYGIVRSDADELKKMKWHVVITDEAQNIKNAETAQSKAVKSIPANTFIAMSGTPVENRLTELWSIMDFCNRGFLGSIKEFKDSFANPIENQNDIIIAEKLKTVTAPFMMRRLKSDKTIISDLPDKIEIDSFGSLAKSQTSLYEKTLQKALEEIEGLKTNDQKSLFVRQGLVLQMILALKQICNHPTQFLKNNLLDASLSGKMELLFDKLESIVESNEKVLIFTQFTEMGKLLQYFIKERFGDEPLFYHGGCSLKQRHEMVEQFQTNRADKIFILSLKAAGTGLNLTAANHVVHYDLWWNPAVEAQATDRAYRIGQKNNVMVHRFITKGTFEERINEMIQNKKHLANMTVATGENWIGNLSNMELKNIFELSDQ